MASNGLADTANHRQRTRTMAKRITQTGTDFLAKVARRGVATLLPGSIRKADCRSLFKTLTHCLYPYRLVKVERDGQPMVIVLAYSDGETGEQLRARARSYAAATFSRYDESWDFVTAHQYTTNGRESVADALGYEMREVDYN